MQKKVKLDAFQAQALQQLMLVCEIRGLENVANKEIQAMNFDLQMDIDKWPVFRPAFDTALQNEVRKRLQIEAPKSRQEGIKDVIRLQLKKRFGRLSASVTKRVNTLSDTETKKLALAILGAKSLKELFSDLGK